MQQFFFTQEQQMLTLEQILHKLQPMNLMEVSRATGIPYMSIWKLCNERYAEPPYSAVKKLSDYLESL